MPGGLRQEQELVIDEINEVIKDMNELLPDARNSLRIIKEMCQHENFTKSWGNIC